MSNKLLETNFDGLVGPTHNYAGLSVGNLASISHKAAVSNPREAALQGIAKMRLLASIGLPQAVLPPQERPDIETLRRIGFSGTDFEILRQAASEAPEQLASVSSASSMWTANAATVAPSSDTTDGRLHLTVANLVNKWHRSIEPPGTARALRAIFRDGSKFSVHDSLPPHPDLGDEGGANHNRLSTSHGEPGLHVFVHGRTVARGTELGPARFPPRQTAEASVAVTRLNRLPAERTLLLAQSPRAIDAGVFHNDVISVSNEYVFLVHEHAFAEGRAAMETVSTRFLNICGCELVEIHVPDTKISLNEAVRSYLFNSQLITLPDRSMALIAPYECQESAAVAAFLEEMVSDTSNPVTRVHVLDLRQSMHNGGGPACLRLRAVLTDEERAVLPGGVWIDDSQATRLENWVKKHYRDSLSQDELADPALLEESRRALDELTQLLGIGSIYPFQLG